MHKGALTAADSAFFLFLTSKHHIVISQSWDFIRKDLEKCIFMWKNLEAQRSETGCHDSGVTDLTFKSVTVTPLFPSQTASQSLGGV